MVRAAIQEKSPTKGGSADRYPALDRPIQKGTFLLWANRKLAEESGYDVRKYAKPCHKMAVDATAKYGLTLKYGKIAGGEMKPVVPGRKAEIGAGG